MAKKLISPKDIEESRFYPGGLVVGFRVWKPFLRNGQSKLFSIAYDSPAWADSNYLSSKAHGISGFFDQGDVKIFQDFVKEDSSSYFDDLVCGVVLGSGDIRVTDYDWQAEEMAVVGLINHNPKSFGLSGFEFNTKEANQWVKDFRKNNSTVYRKHEKLKDNLACADIYLKQENKTLQANAILASLNSKPEKYSPKVSSPEKPALGFRSWKLKDNRLYSVIASVPNTKTYSGIALKPGQNKASCYPLSFMYEGNHPVGKKHSSPSPDPKCSCGFYAFHTYSELKATPYSYHTLTKTVSGAVAGSGNMLVYENGWRAEQLQILGLLSDGVRPSISPSDDWLLLLNIARFYQVPLFTDINLLQRHSRRYANQVSF